MGEVEELANPSVEVSQSENAILVRTTDPLHNADRAAVTRKMLARRTDLIVSTEPDQSLSIAIAPGAHIVAPPALQPKEFVQSLRARMSRLNIGDAKISGLETDRAKIVFASRSDADAFRRSLQSFTGVVFRSVDTAVGVSSPPASSDERFVLPTGETIWVNPLTNAGREHLSVATASHVGQRFGVIVNGSAVSAPVIREPISGAELEISGNFTQSGAAALIRSIEECKNDLPLMIVSEAAYPN